MQQSCSASGRSDGSGMFIRIFIFETARKLYVPAALLDYKFSPFHEKGELVNPMYIKKAIFLKEDLGDYDSGQQFEYEKRRCSNHVE